MVELVLNEEQLELLSSAEGLVPVRDAHGNQVGTFSPEVRSIHLTAEELQTINRRMTADPATFSTFRETIERLEAREKL